MTDLPKGKWCECGYPHETGGPCWECRAYKLETGSSATHAARLETDMTDYYDIEAEGQRATMTTRTPDLSKAGKGTAYKIGYRDGLRMTDRENDALRATNIEQAAEIGILRTEKHADAEAIGSQDAEIERLRAALGSLGKTGSAFFPDRTRDRCIHRKRSDQDCAMCVAKFANNALAQEAQTNE